MPTKESLLATIEEFKQELVVQEAAVLETKQIINTLSRRAGQAEPFTDLEGRSGVTPPVSNKMEIKLDEFASAASPSDAVITYLKKKGEAAPLDEVHAALKRGGYTGSKNIADLRVAVGKRDDIRRFPETDAVGLEEWYGGAGRRRSKSIPDMIRGATDKNGKSGTQKPPQEVDIPAEEESSEESK
jgi:hypothetical protein